MSAKHAKKNEFNAKILLLVVAIIIFVIFAMMYITKISSDDEGKKENNLQAKENLVENTIIEQPEISQNEVNGNTIEENVVENPEITDNTVEKQQEASTEKDKNIPETKMQPGVTDQKQKAIELVKKQWGSDDTVDFVFDYVNEKGEYVVAVKDRQTATVKYYFRVNLETETVELD